MGIDFGKLKEKAMGTVKTVGEKTSSTAKTVKIKTKIASEKSEIAELKKQLGEKIWEKFEAGEAMDQELSAICEEISNHLHTIDIYKDDIAKLKEKPAEDETEAEDAEEIEAVEAEETAEEPVETEVQDEASPEE